MSINPGGAANYSWNYSKPDKPDYSTTLVGTVIAIQEVQKRGYTMNGQPGQPEFWPDGNPKMNIRLALVTDTGDIKTFTFQPASKAARMGQKRSVHMDLFHLTGDTDMMNLVGKTIAISTQEGRYGQGNPRPWTVQLLEVGPYQLAGPMPAEFKAPQVLADNATSGGQVIAPAPQQPYQPMPQQQYQQPQYPYQPQQPAQFQPRPQQYAQPMYQPQPMQPQPAMDPAIVSAMASQAFGAPATAEVVRQQPTDPVGGGQVYDEDMPF
jgi:hypothetical protein